MTLKQASDLIRSARRPLVICHVAPDGDAIGSALGLGLALRRLDQTPTLACSDPVPSRFGFLQGVETITQELSEPFDLVIAVDCSDEGRMGSLAETPGFRDVLLLNIDHHVTNLGYGDVNLVDTGAASTTEVILRLVEHLGLPLDEELATPLLTGIVTDTQGFRTNNVTLQVMEAAVRLMQTGVPLPPIMWHGLDRRGAGSMRLWGAALSRLKVEKRVIWTTIPFGLRRETGSVGNGDTGLANYLVGAIEADVSAVLTEQEDGRVEVGMRAEPGYDVAQVALRFGGGGHTLAAGFGLPGPLEEAEAKVVPALKADLARQRQAREENDTVSS